jgi:hypothetical protein
MTFLRLAVLSWALPLLTWLPAAPVIREFSPAGQGSLIDDDNDFPDWIELHNPAAEPYLLTDHFLTDDLNHLTKWAFPRGQSIKADQRLLIFASRKDKTNIFAGTVHTNFALETSSGFLTLVAKEGTLLHQWQDYPKQRPGVSYGVDADVVYFAEPTPERASAHRPDEGHQLQRRSRILHRDTNADHFF